MAAAALLAVVDRNQLRRVPILLLQPRQMKHIPSALLHLSRATLQWRKSFRWPRALQHRPSIQDMVFFQKIWNLLNFVSKKELFL
ncbi:Mccc1 [Phodopus roborovskii]|uniref:Mccc1 protein n=1 Tax=Phodopus roborovskii TaxID=109678 RepID=A0AAU9Z9D5_PHORO|nr:Mccc1 [Phodopus roborovskii]